MNWFLKQNLQFHEQTNSKKNHHQFETKFGDKILSKNDQWSFLNTILWELLKYGFFRRISENYGGIKTALSKSKIHVCFSNRTKNRKMHEFGFKKMHFYISNWMELRKRIHTKSNENE